MKQKIRNGKGKGKGKIFSMKSGMPVLK